MRERRTTHGPLELLDLRILVVDDDAAALLLTRRMLERAGYRQVATTSDPERVSASFEEIKPDLLMLDLHMPGVDGFKLMEQLAVSTGDGVHVPLIVLTADTSEAAKRSALALGARDLLTKPVDQTEFLLKVANVLRIHSRQRELAGRGDALELRVAQQGKDLEQARFETMHRLALAAELRDSNRQDHARRIGRTAGLLALELGLPGDEPQLIEAVAPLHDIGKIGIPDSILLAPRRLVQDEMETMKSHTTIGAELLAGSESPVLQLAEVIARTHHERWDGAGYPAGHDAERTPAAGRIVAVADAFDALTHERPYKSAWPPTLAAGEIRAQRGRQFDPAVADAFERLDPEILFSVADEDGEVLSGRSGKALVAAGADG